MMHDTYHMIYDIRYMIYDIYIYQAYYVKFHASSSITTLKSSTIGCYLPADIGIRTRQGCACAWFVYINPPIFTGKRLRSGFTTTSSRGLITIWARMERWEGHSSFFPLKRKKHLPPPPLPIFSHTQKP